MLAAWLSMSKAFTAKIAKEHRKVRKELLGALLSSRAENI